MARLGLIDWCDSLLADEIAVVVGPTASGKTALAIALSQRLDGEVIGADSVQVYRHFERGTGKPSPEERRAAPHHLIDIAEPDEGFDAARFVQLADAAIDEIWARGRRPIVCGGTFLWVKALLHGLAPMPAASPEIRREHAVYAETNGRLALHRRLAEVDPDAATRLEPNDLVRVSRALEVWQLTGQTQTELHREHQFRPVRHRARLVGIDWDRPVLDERLRTRVRGWLADGWIDEVGRLIEQGWAKSRPMGAVGFRQVHDHLNGVLPIGELEDAIVRATRTFVRRQRTWLRDQPVTWLPPDASD